MKPENHDANNSGADIERRRRASWWILHHSKIMCSTSALGQTRSLVDVCPGELAQLTSFHFA
jgi:hypothetical protein